jgi:hypothetical protein
MIIEDASYTDYDAYDKPKNGEIITIWAKIQQKTKTL